MSALSELLLSAGLTGRGGADFPTGAKLALAERHNAELIINACDGELDAAKDSWVIANHLPEVLEGARRITGQRIRVSVHRDSSVSATLREAGVGILEVPRRYVSSEESALTRLAAGGPAKPLMRFEPIAAGSRDVAGRRLPPTLVLNAETVWRVQQIIDRGPRWFRSYGTPDEPGPRLVTVANGVEAPGVHAVEAGLAMREILHRAGGLTVPTQALWISGLSGGFLGAADIFDTEWSRAGLARHHIGPGAGTIRVMDARADPWHELLDALTYAAGETAGQCGPCRFGLPALAQTLAGLLEADPPPDAGDRLGRILAQVSGRGACRFPDGVAGLLSSALEVFGAPAMRRPAMTDSQVE
ncbi:NADH-ubiquinone oxidoreductase-F iron-sulfur binding region domain-containing protein [Nocardia niigatensis]|uniref:NADH-ubiquinone oxidoreductase-F iron-sulfur binding region domain-containing protein n=1 Tax=Nocardia niigatensis TaxID=209249 RepID=UPI0003027103|nr:NADH-ubiquinone oxidoreductase-F iron-sulfur binding region domain-containing protein [Nocardia niigatensis]